MNALATQTLARIKEALQTSEAASVAQVIQLIREIADKGDSMPVQQLAELISRDLTTMSKVLRVANTLGYNPEGIEVTTITQAINVIGFEKVRNLAVSLLLVENAEGKTVSEESRVVASQAVASGLVAESIMEIKHVLDPEQSFVCAALRNYGKLLLTTFLLEDYRRARNVGGATDPDDAFRTVFGLTPLELGYEVLHSAQLPHRLLRCLQTTPERVSARSSPDDRMVVLADFAVKYCELIQENGASPAAFERESAALLARFGQALDLSCEELNQVLEAVDRKLATFATVHGVRVFTSPLMKNIGLLASRKAETAEPGSAPAGTGGVTRGKGPLQPKEIVLNGLAEVAQLVANEPGALDKILEASRRCVQAALKLTHCVIFLKETYGPLLSARVGGGSLFDQIRGLPLLDPRKPDIFNAALTRGDDVLVQNSSDRKFAGLIPDWLRAVGPNKTVLLLPIRDETGTFALILGVSELLLPLELAQQLKPQLKLLRGHVAMARG